jgi:hypothetical protein
VPVIAVVRVRKKRQHVVDMHIRSRLHHRRLQISLVETRRIDGKVRQQHVASLGSIPPDMTIQHRVASWTQLHPRMDDAVKRDHDKLSRLEAGEDVQVG